MGLHLIFNEGSRAYNRLTDYETLIRIHAAIKPGIVGAIQSAGLFISDVSPAFTVAACAYAGLDRSGYPNAEMGAATNFVVHHERHPGAGCIAEKPINEPVFRGFTGGTAEHQGADNRQQRFA